MKVNSLSDFSNLFPSPYGSSFIMINGQFLNGIRKWGLQTWCPLKDSAAVMNKMANPFVLKPVEDCYLAASLWGAANQSTCEWSPCLERFQRSTDWLFSLCCVHHFWFCLPQKSRVFRFLVLFFFIANIILNLFKKLPFLKCVICCNIQLKESKMVFILCANGWISLKHGKLKMMLHIFLLPELWSIAGTT